MFVLPAMTPRSPRRSGTRIASLQIRALRLVPKSSPRRAGTCPPTSAHIAEFVRMRFVAPPRHSAAARPVPGASWRPGIPRTLRRPARVTPATGAPSRSNHIHPTSCHKSSNSHTRALNTALIQFAATTHRGMTGRIAASSCVRMATTLRAMAAWARANCCFGASGNHPVTCKSWHPAPTIYIPAGYTRLTCRL